MPSGLKRTKRISPMPIVSSFAAPNMEKTYVEPTSYIMTPEQLAEVIAKYGAPTMLLSSRRTPMQHQRPGKKKAKV